VAARGSEGLEHSRASDTNSGAIISATIDPTHGNLCLEKINVSHTRALLIDHPRAMDLIDEIGSRDS